MSVNKLNYILQLADNALIIGHRISEWCGHGPILEQDIAITNTALDHLGQARSLFQYAAEVYNDLTPEARQSAFTNLNLPEGQEADEDTLPYLRDAWDFKNALLLEQDNKDWAYTIARSFYYDQFAVLHYTALKNSKDVVIAAIAEKSLKEAKYHLKWSSEWVIRLGDGTPESHAKIQEAINELWAYSGELFIPSEAEKDMIAGSIATPMEHLKTEWLSNIYTVLSEATLSMPDANAWMHTGGKTGTHTEHMGFILTQLQYVQRAYPNMSW
ncbi:phenylacetate-CoA oxygenase subunit PaaI [Taibaiella sp. KBW10]|uniref:1,2-phenylacetyl-CoA epoxidase subunit PaaC n=1 Tax=Taibaiella sp. KBW10 TaxID=2153357 RepID=UPI000F59F15E|nr:1,2-phenylacetyl-CoA epoxidase subunit PaaC [Taibaiella sp. KBW10]RQO30711.1 phenylacetate-CoA oxygenase subunit PaaI [Taibaiella sp. KBW10]